MAKKRSAGSSARPARVRWDDSPAAQDYPAAESYLRLLADPDLVAACSDSLLHSVTIHQHAKDILRAAGLPLLAVKDPAVARDLRKITDGIALSPVLLVRGDLRTGRRLEIADGYHRVCASYHLSEDTEIPCRLVPLPSVGE